MIEVATQEWIDQVRDEHEKLEGMVQNLKEFLDQPRPELGVPGAHSWAAEMTSRLVALHDEFFRHFRFEEQGGMVEELELAHPEATREVEQIVDEHSQILSLVRKLMTSSMAYSEGIESTDSALRTGVTDLLERFSEHERVETALIQRLEYRDFGGGD